MSFLSMGKTKDCWRKHIDLSRQKLCGYPNIRALFWGHFVNFSCFVPIKAFKIGIFWDNPCSLSKILPRGTCLWTFLRKDFFSKNPKQIDPLRRGSQCEWNTINGWSLGPSGSWSYSWDPGRPSPPLASGSHPPPLDFKLTEEKKHPGSYRGGFILINYCPANKTQIYQVNNSLHSIFKKKTVHLN